MCWCLSREGITRPVSVVHSVRPGGTISSRLISVGTMYRWRHCEVRRYDSVQLVCDNNGPRAKTVIFILTRELEPRIPCLQRSSISILLAANYSKGILHFNKAIDVIVLGFMCRLQVTVKHNAFIFIFVSFHSLGSLACAHSELIPKFESYRVSVGLLDGWSACRKAVTYTEQSKCRINADR
jgi:hypothetical protein